MSNVKIEVESPNLVRIPLTDILSNPFQVRMVDDEISFDRLKKNIASLGLLERPCVRKHPKKEGKYQLLWGHRRMKAMKELGKTDVLVELVDASEKDMALDSLGENLSRANLNDFEMGRAFKMLQDSFEMGTRQIGEIYGFTQSTIINYIKAAGYEEELVSRATTDNNEEKLVDNIEMNLTESHIRHLRKLPKDQQYGMTVKTMERRLSVKALIDEIQHVTDVDEKAKEELEKINKFVTRRIIVLDPCPICNESEFEVIVQKCTSCNRRF